MSAGETCRFLTDIYQTEIDCLSRNGIERFFCKFRVISALSDAILVMSLPNSFFSALGYEASARETFFGFIAYKTLYLRRTDNEFEALPNKQSAFSTIPNVSVTETV